MDMIGFLADLSGTVLTAFFVFSLFLAVVQFIRLIGIVLFSLDFSDWLGDQIFKARIWRNPSILNANYIRRLSGNRMQIALDKYGFDRLLDERFIKPYLQDSVGTLYFFAIRDELFKVVRVINSSPEPDGSFKPYYLRVPNFICTPREAVAWTFGLSEHEYSPLLET